MQALDSAGIRAYIEQHRLEEELTSAVNTALNERSDDPFGVLAHHFRALSSAGDEGHPMEEEDDILLEDAPPPPKARGKRGHVMCTPVVIPDGWRPPIIEKSEAQLAFLEDAMRENKLMRLLSPTDRAQLIAAFSPKSWESGTTIIKQGDRGEHFYVVESGTADVSIQGVGKVMVAAKGTAFGELALLHDAPRAATVISTSAMTTFSIDALTFKSLLMGKSQQDAREVVGFLGNVRLLASLGEAAKRELADTAVERLFEAGTNIICEGEDGHEFFIIKTGEVKCTKVGEEGEVSRRLSASDFFGELALLRTDKRAATVTATKDTICLCISRAAFTRLLGPLSEFGAVTAEQERRSST